MTKQFDPDQKAASDMIDKEYHFWLENHAKHLSKMVLDIEKEREALKKRIATLESALDVAVNALNLIASNHRPQFDSEYFWLHEKTHEQCAEVVATDTVKARDALAEIKRIRESK